MTSADLLADAFGRIRENVHAVLDGLTSDQLSVRLDPEANTIAWLVWHLTRIQDDHMADVADTGQQWTSGGWAERFHLPADPANLGYGHTTDEVAAITTAAADADLLRAYHDAVHTATLAYVRRLTDADLPRIVDERWDPPVTLAVRLVSVINDDMQHVGQAAYVRGIVLRAR